MTTADSPHSPRPFLTPPGGVLVWGFVLMELVVFLVGFVVFYSARASEPALFLESQRQLSQALALTNTLVLLTSGYSVWLANLRFDRGDRGGSVRWLLRASALGALFLVLKGVEYAGKIQAGLTPETNTFFEMYWLLTAFHAAHVVLGVVILLFFARRIHTGRVDFEADMNLSTGSAFWHMCDLIWVLLMPTLYLV
jgi:nitric oxide reductase NorE protein